MMHERYAKFMSKTPAVYVVTVIEPYYILILLYKPYYTHMHAHTHARTHARTHTHTHTHTHQR